MKYVLQLDDKRIDGLTSPKITGYSILNTARKYNQHFPWANIPPLPAPFLVSHPDVTRRSEILPEYLQELADSIHTLFSSDQEVVALRTASNPHMDHLPSARIPLSHREFADYLKSKVSGMIAEVAKKYVNEAVIYAHPWEEPEGYVGSADVYVSPHRLAPVKIVSSYGSGLGLEWGGDSSIVTPRD